MEQPYCGNPDCQLHLKRVEYVTARWFPESKRWRSVGGFKPELSKDQVLDVERGFCSKSCELAIVYPAIEHTQGDGI